VRAATFDYLRTVINAPVLRVIGWSAFDTRVGSAYMIMEKVNDITLHERQQSDPPAEYYGRLLTNIKKTEDTCLKAVFSHFGSLYYKEDVTPDLQKLAYANSSRIKDGADRFRIGPSTRRAFWRGERAAMNLDRGPMNAYNSLALVSLVADDVVLIIFNL
jgi:hypothetical protein